LKTYSPATWKNQEEIYRFLDTYGPLKLNQEDINNFNRFITSNENETVIKNLPMKKSQDLDRVIADFYWTFKEELTPTLLKFFHKIQKEGILPN
jgi:hypothetical protein